MKKLTFLIILAAINFSGFAARVDTLYQNTPAATVKDSLLQKLNATPSDSLKATIYTQIASEYLKYDTITNKKTKLYYQNQALSYTLLALHGYSKYNDSVGLLVSFNALAKVYRAQKKYSQAKWFILQANTLSRDKNDQPNIVATLTELAGIKMDIKDYDLAKRDLDEALKLSAANHYALAEALVQQNYALLYSHLKKYDKEALAMRRRDHILDSVKKAQAAILIAQVNAQHAAQSKKKVNWVSYRHSYKTNFSKKISSI